MSAVNHPSHYNLPGKKECIEQMKEDYGETITAIFCLTNAYKYLYRAGEKEGNSASQDIEKAKWYYRYLSEIVDMVTFDYKLEKLEDYVYRRLKQYDKS
jgi:hypothetical protein